MRLDDEWLRTRSVTKGRREYLSTTLYYTTSSPLAPNFLRENGRPRRRGIGWRLGKNHRQRDLLPRRRAGCSDGGARLAIRGPGDTAHL